VGETPLLILAPRVTDDSVRLWQVALAAGWRCQRLASWRVPPALREYPGEICLYAEPLFAEAVADALGLALLEPSVDWLTRVPAALLSREVQLRRLAEAAEFEFPSFVKPAEGKTFEARVYGSFGELPTIERIGDLDVLISTPVDFELEVRCFVRDGSVVTASPYWRGGALAMTENGWPFQPGEEAPAMEFAGEVLRQAEVPPALVLDVGRLADGRWAVIEANPCWGAGLYGCDPAEALETARRSVRRVATLTETERRWA